MLHPYGGQPGTCLHPLTVDVTEVTAALAVTAVSVVCAVVMATAVIGRAEVTTGQVTGIELG